MEGRKAQDGKEVMEERAVRESNGVERKKK
jgi:hypothetical protein